MTSATAVDPGLRTLTKRVWSEIQITDEGKIAFIVVYNNTGQCVTTSACCGGNLVSDQLQKEMQIELL